MSTISSLSDSALIVGPEMSYSNRLLMVFFSLFRQMLIQSLKYSMAALFHPFQFTVDLFIVENPLLSIQRNK